MKVVVFSIADFYLITMSISYKKAQLTKNIIFIIIGSALSAISINLFIIPANILSGGISGIALIIQYMTNFPIALSTLILNIPLFILSILKINKKFTILTGVGLLSMSIFLSITSPITTILSPIQLYDKLVFCIFGGILNGIGLGIVFSNYGSTGGIDILSMYLKKKYDFNISTISFLLNFLIISIGAVLFEFTIALYTLISIYCTTAFMEKVIKGFNTQKMVLIITKRETEISKAILNELNRGITMLYAEGAYSKSRVNMLYCIISLRQLPKMKEIIKSIDSSAFVSIIDTAEVQGNGFINPLT